MFESPDLPEGLSLSEIRKTAERIAPHVLATPFFRYQRGQGTLQLKFEFLQNSGSFKVRGAVNNALLLNQNERECGVTAVSAGNHAIAVAYAAKALDINAKVVMLDTANPFRIKRCRELGAEVVLAETKDAFELMERIFETEGRSIIHPFEGMDTMQGTATLGLEIAETFDQFDILLVAVGGGGLISGVGAAIKQVYPEVRLIGIEPEGAPGMTESLKRGQPLEQVEVVTIADSIGAPLHAPVSFGVCRQVIDKMVLVSDDSICAAMAFAADELKLVLEPAGCAVLAALAGPLRDECAGQSVAAILCGSNIDTESWSELVSRGRKYQEAS